MWYKAVFEDDNFEMILADNDQEAIENAWELEEECGTLFNVFEIDENDNETRTIY